MQLELKQKIYSQNQLQQHNFALGKKGENHARQYLLERGFLVLAENFQVASGAEIDLICLSRDIKSLAPSTQKFDLQSDVDTPPILNNSQFTFLASDVLVFIEVKTRESDQYGWAGQSAVNHQKLLHTQTAAREFRYQNYRQLGKLDFRFDVLTVILSSLEAKPEIQHFENVTWLRRGFRL